MTYAKTRLLVLLALVLAMPAGAQQPPQAQAPSDDAAVWYLTGMLMVEQQNPDLSIEDLEDLLHKITQGEGTEDDLAKASKALAHYNVALGYARRGAGLDRCTWPVDVKQDGPMALLPHLGQARRMARLLQGSAALNIEQGDLADAETDLITIMSLARHCATDRLLISMLVQFSIESLATDVMAQHLHRFNHAQLRSLSEARAGLPARVTLKQSIGSERAMAVWLQKTHREQGLDHVNELFFQFIEGEHEQTFKSDKQFEQWLEELYKAYDELQKIANLLPTKFFEMHKDFEQRVADSDNPLIRTLMPTISAARVAELKAHALFTMVDAMIAYRLGGRAAFDAATDPYDGKPFGFEVTDAGVVVSSRLVQSDQQVTLTFSGEIAEPLE